MALWQRLVLTLVVMLIASYLSGVIWLSIFNVNLPSYVGGMVGGLVAIPVWELLKRFGGQRRR